MPAWRDFCFDNRPLLHSGQTSRVASGNDKTGAGGPLTEAINAAPAAGRAFCGGAPSPRRSRHQRRGPLNGLIHPPVTMLLAAQIVGRGGAAPPRPSHNRCPRRTGPCVNPVGRASQRRPRQRDERRPICPFHATSDSRRWRRPATRRPPLGRACSSPEAVGTSSERTRSPSNPRHAPSPIQTAFRWDVQPFSQKSRTLTVAKEFQIGLYDPAEADLEHWRSTWCAGFLRGRL